MVPEEGVKWMWEGEGRAVGLDMSLGFGSLLSSRVHPPTRPIRVSSRIQPALPGM